MRKIFTFLLLATATLSSLAQSQTDHEAVLKLCIDLPEIQNLFPTDAHGDPQSLRIMQHAVSFDANLSLVKFGRDVEFLSKDQIYNRNTIAFLRFDKLDISGSFAFVEFDFHFDQAVSDPNRNIVMISLSLAKQGTEWVL